MYKEDTNQISWSSYSHIRSCNGVRPWGEIETNVFRMIGFNKCMMVIYIEIASWKCWLVFSGKLNHVMNLEQSRNTVTGY